MVGCKLIAVYDFNKRIYKKSNFLFKLSLCNQKFETLTIIHCNFELLDNFYKVFCDFFFPQVHQGFNIPYFTLPEIEIIQLTLKIFRKYCTLKSYCFIVIFSDVSAIRYPKFMR